MLTMQLVPAVPVFIVRAGTTGEWPPTRFDNSAVRGLAVPTNRICRALDNGILAGKGYLRRATATSGWPRVPTRSDRTRAAR